MPFPQTAWIWKDGALIPWDDARIHVLSHVVQYGSSVFEGVRCYRTPNGPSLFRVQAHVQRLLASCRVYRMTPPHDAQALVRACIDVVRRNGLDEGYLRPVTLRGLGAPGIHGEDSPLETYVACWPWGRYLGDDAVERGADACVSSWRRAAPDTFPLLAKAGGHYLSAQLMKAEAIANGYSEAIALSVDGLVSEGTAENLFLVQDGTLITPSIDGSMLPGITRDCVLTVARDFGVPVAEKRVPREALYTADEVFLSGTAAEITPIRSVDRVPVGDGSVGPITRLVQQRYLGIARGTLEDPWGWRTLVDPAMAVAV
jgi:branched-chain amino acid aminotransferase